jgi:hypothetical protein
MIDETDSIFDGLDRTLIDFSSKLAEPLCWAYGMVRWRSISPLDPNKFDNTSSKITEIATRIFIFASAALAFAFAATHIIIATAIIGASSKLLRAVGFALQKDHFTHVRGNAPETTLTNGQASVLTWSLSGEWGGLSYKEGGVVHWRSRIDQIVDKIKAENPDVIVLQKIDDTALAEALVGKLKDDYAHFFTHLGGGTWQSVNGCMVITKCAVSHFDHNEIDKETSFETIELKAHPEDKLPAVRFIATSLIPGPANEEKRMDQVAHIVHALAKETLVLPTLLIGSNANRDAPVEGAFLSKYLHHSYRGQEPNHTDQLALQWDPNFKGTGESFDIVSLFRRNALDGTTLPVIEKNIRMIDCHLVEGFDKTFNTQTALSSNHGTLTQFSGLKS